MFANIKYVLLTAHRDLLFYGLTAAILACMALSSFLGGTALVEQDQMSIAYIAGASRMVLMVGLMVFVSFHVRRSFENREIELMLVRPISRVDFLLGYLMGFCLVSLIFVAFVMGAFMLVPSDAGSGGKAMFFIVNKKGFIMWGISVYLESLIVVAFSLAAALILKSAVSAVIATMGFYVIARLSGFFAAFMSTIMFKAFEGSVSGQAFRVITTLFPRLDFFGKSEWLIYGPGGIDEIKLMAVQVTIYFVMLFALAVCDLKRKQF